MLLACGGWFGFVNGIKVGESWVCVCPMCRTHHVLRLSWLLESESMGSRWFELVYGILAGGILVCDSFVCRIRRKLLDFDANTTCGYRWWILVGSDGFGRVNGNPTGGVLVCDSVVCRISQRLRTKLVAEPQFGQNGGFSFV